MSALNPQAELQVADLVLEVRHSPGRRTLGLTVDRGGELILHLPSGCDLEAGRRFVEEKRFWIYRKLAEKDRLFAPPRRREYVSGEGFYYLGRSYRLKLVDPGTAEYTASPLRLHRGRFMLHREERDRARKHFAEWYTLHGEKWIDRRVGELARRIGVSVSSLRVRDLGYRWGSCSASGGVNFHWRTVLLPPAAVEYVVAHELVHLIVPDHSTDFWTRLERVMPDFAARKKWLAENGARFI